MEKQEAQHQWEMVKKAVLNNRPATSVNEHGQFMDYLRKGAGMIQKGLTKEEGEILIPQTLIENIEERLQQLSPMRRVSKVHTIHTDRLDLVSDQDRPEVGWMESESALDATKLPDWKRQSIHLHTLYAKPCISQQLLDDVFFDLEKWLSHRIAEHMARLENKAFTKGDGQHQPKGFLSLPTSELGHGDASHIEELKTAEVNLCDGLLDIMHALSSDYAHGSVWMMNRLTLARIKKLKNNVTGHFLWQPSLAHETPETLLGQPIVLNDDMDERIAFGNFGYAYQIVDRSNPGILRDPYSAKPFVEFFATKRVGGDVIQPHALKLLKIESE